MSLLTPYNSALLPRCSIKRVSTSYPHARATFSLRHKSNQAKSRPSVLSSSLDTNQNQKRRLPPNADTVGPFQLGLAGQQVNMYEKVKPWSQLSTSGKVLRTGARTSNLTVILLGAGLSAVLIYSLTSELFSKNSPTVLHADACERIKSSPKVAKLIQGPLTFHNNTPLLHRPRHHNHQVPSQIVVEPSGREHMLLHFYVQGKQPGSTPISEESYLDRASTFATDTCNQASGLTWDDTVSLVQSYVSTQADRLRSVFRYVSGAPALSPTPQAATPAPQAKSASERKSEGFFGLFGSLRGSSQDALEGTSDAFDGESFAEGEVHADLVRNDEGYFVFRYLLIDLPASRAARPRRIFLEKTAGVRENEPVMRWHSS
ncbi:TIM21-domain-containing protein [Pterulicium gracile]|uniref:Mitochondrial import inner membrane translocase subunit Tim21 n=1 Tax=Pterulicium gracile TaxID=1884261 RepID=A0A5C3QWW8_9AGAR|nr:TIM21-domain-containing protein [Pterula gracilis]